MKNTIDETRPPTIAELVNRRRRARVGPWTNTNPRRWLPSARAVLELEVEVGERAADALVYWPFEGFHGSEGPLSVALHATLGYELPPRASREDRAFFRRIRARVADGELLVK